MLLVLILNAAANQLVNTSCTGSDPKAIENLQGGNTFLMVSVNWTTCCCCLVLVLWFLPKYKKGIKQISESIRVFCCFFFNWSLRITALWEQITHFQFIYKAPHVISRCFTETVQPDHPGRFFQGFLSKGAIRAIPHTQFKSQIYE